VVLAIALTGCTNLWVDSERVLDFDGDGFPSASEDPALVDCDDFDQSRNPLANEICDGIDNDCDGDIDDADISRFLSPEDPVFYKDNDGDGFGDATDWLQACALPAEYAENDLDCDDLDGDLGPPDTWYPDADRDLFGDASDPGQVSCVQPEPFFVPNNGDCNDQNASIHPGVVEGDCLGENPEDAVDLNCDGQVGLVDNDLDGVLACDDCNDNDETVYPDAPEVCDGQDNNCDGSPDNDADDALTWYADMDSDGLVDDEHHSLSCSAYPRWVHVDVDSCEDCLDCDDYNPNIGGPLSWFPDTDDDGFGDTESEPGLSCDTIDGSVLNNGDCDDSRSDIHPSVIEGCGSDVDLNCDGTVEEIDGDGDGFLACDECDDTNPLIFPGAEEHCDNIDNDCNGAVDDGSFGEASWFWDGDLDGYGTADIVQTGCVPELGFVGNDEDCDDSDASVNPIAEEVCNGRDDDCLDGIPGEEVDDDLDGFVECEIPDGVWVDISIQGGEDCDDRNPEVYTGAVEICNRMDDDCDGLWDEMDPDLQGVPYYADADGDGYGDPDIFRMGCPGLIPVGSVENDQDCDDNDSQVYPGSPNQAEETWYDGRDTNCDGDDDTTLLAETADFRVTGESGDAMGTVAVFAGPQGGSSVEPVLIGSELHDPEGRVDAGAVALHSTWARPTLSFSDGDILLLGDHDNMHFGRSVAGVGDLDSDTRADLAVGAHFNGSGSGDPGAVFLFLGGTSSGGSDQYNALIEGVGQDQAGYALAGVGDVNGDLVDDLLVGAPGLNGDGGAGLFLGPLQGGGTLLTNADALFSVGGPISLSQSSAGTTLAALSDLDGDGLGDYAIGAPTASGSGLAYAGQVYVLFGDSVLPSSDLQNADVVLTGEYALDYAGAAIADAGDMDGDGNTDLLVFSQGTQSLSAGVSYLLVGVNAQSDLGSAEAVFNGERQGDLAGSTLSGAGDVNGDGSNDLLLGSSEQSADRGAIYLVHGPVSGTELLTSAHVKISGDETSDFFGASLDGMGDINGDGAGDVLVGGSGIGAAQDGGVLIFLGGG